MVDAWNTRPSGGSGVWVLVLPLHDLGIYCFPKNLFVPQMRADRAARVASTKEPIMAKDLSHAR